MKRTTVIWVFMSLFCSVLSAQTTDLLPGDTLKAATVVDQRLVVMEREQLQSLDSLDRRMNASSDLGELLQQAGAMNLKVYGAGGISSLSLRGGQASQTAVLWNGMNLQDPLNGGVNFSLLPAFFLDEVDIHTGGHSALFGSGAISGSIHTSSRLRFGEGFSVKLQQQLASFGEHQSAVDVRYSGKRFLNISKVLYKEADNDFPYINDQQFGKPRVHQQNAHEESIGFMQENALLVLPGMRLSSHVWWLKSSHEVPGNMTISGANQWQDDASLKAMLVWKYAPAKWMLTARSAFFYTELVYHSPDLDLVARHSSRVLTSEFEARRSWKKRLFLDMGVSQRFVQGISNDLEAADPQLRSIAAFTALTWRLKDALSVQANVRQEVRDEQLKVPSYSLRISAKPTDKMMIWLSGSRNYRMPTFNDLYWVDGFSKGNPMLNDEYGYSCDANAQWNYQRNKMSVQAHASVYLQQTHDMIQWLPDNNGVWSPVNHKKVSGRGTEARLAMGTQLGSVKLGVKLQHQYTISTLSESVDPNEQNLDNQLIYTPYHQASARFTVSWRKFFLGIQQASTGKRFASADNSSLHTLDPFHLLHLQLGKQLQFQQHCFDLSFKIHNLTDESYQLVQYYPLPGISYELLVSYRFNQKSDL